MRRKELLEVKTKEKCFEFSDIKNFTLFTIGAKVEGDSILKYLSLSAILKINLGGKKVVIGKILDGEVYLYFSDGEIARFLDGEKVFSVYVKEKIESFIIGKHLGKKTVFAISEQGYAISLNGEGVSFKLKKGDCYLFFNNRIFSAKNNKIYFAESDDLSFLDCQFNSIILPQNEEILGIFNLSEKLYVMTKQSVYTLVFGYSNEEVVLKKICSLQEEPIKNTILEFKGKIYFLTKSGLNVLEANAVKKLSTGLDNLMVNSFSKAFIIENYLVFMVNSDELTGYFAYDFFSGEGTFIEVMEDVMVLDGGFISNDGYLYLLNVNSNFKFYWFSKKIDLGEIKEKTIYLIELFSVYPAEIKLIYDEGEVSYSLSKGYNRLCVNIKTQQLSMLICGGKKNAKVSSVKIFYRV